MEAAGAGREVEAGAEAATAAAGGAEAEVGAGVAAIGWGAEIGSLTEPAGRPPLPVVLVEPAGADAGTVADGPMEPDRVPVVSAVTPVGVDAEAKTDVDEGSGPVDADVDGPVGVDDDETPGGDPAGTREVETPEGVPRGGVRSRAAGGSAGSAGWTLRTIPAAVAFRRTRSA
ncbi:MAG: hypothetical protein ACT4OS_08115 [Acidimicrobiales bacterium]